RELAPADLDTAKQALRKAEQAYLDDAESQKTKDLSYVAHRKALLAELSGQIEEADRRRLAAEKAYKDLTESELERQRLALQINKVAAALKDQSYPPIRIEGHTDSVGSADDNRKLSLSRADAVRDQLVSQGYPTAKIVTAGLGPDHPVADNGTPEGRANNRRV